MASTCWMRNLAGDVLGKAEVEFDFGIAPWVLTVDNAPALVGELSYLIARRALTADMVSSGV